MITQVKIVLASYIISGYYKKPASTKASRLRRLENSHLPKKINVEILFTEIIPGPIYIVFLGYLENDL